MNRKNLTAAVLAGLAGAAGIAGTAQAVNLNPDGLGQVLIYPYYTSNDGNFTLLSVVNTTDAGKAVKVRFKEGFNSREVLDFNMYMSAYDVWVAAIIEGPHVSGTTGTPTLVIPDSTCTVPYLYLRAPLDPAKQPGDDQYAGTQIFLPHAYAGSNNDGGPTHIQRAAEGYFEMIEMGTIHTDTDTYDDIVHEIDDDGVQAPADCLALDDAWNPDEDGYWIADPTEDISRNSGGLFGGAAIINGARGTMFSYDAKAIQGYNQQPHGNHFEPGDSHPSLNEDGGELSATVFFGVPNDTAVTLHYDRPVDAISAVFMHEFSMNEYNIDPGLNAASEWVITFPTKNWYVDEDTLDDDDTYWIPDVEDRDGCNGWDPGEYHPKYYGQTDFPEGWQQCNWLELDSPDAPVPPFTSVFDDDGACEPFDIVNIWDREENAGEGGTTNRPPVVSPKPPPGSDTPDEDAMCYEVNVLRFGNSEIDPAFPVIFGTPNIEGSSLLKTVDTGAVDYDGGTKSKPKLAGWAKINWFTSPDAVLDPDWDGEGHVDYNGLVGLPVTGFWAEQFENGYLGTPSARVLANYGGLFQHKGNVRRIAPAYVHQGSPESE